ncbi:MAG: SRPBCC domain-containing protein [Paracoccaceae bacterium]|nr:SRPBCC domain-containing protein [Paracoccaceae bacterium]MDE2674347.1 SRPBCC domain-containing protein [Paracoccaceae bacterium]MXZ50757.1 SRPBCC domain-containing protein [Paracoccaceae bacterium]MYF46222.1 SRPBCC domain-containing protein [Paracoccaceae bacterium]MYI90472.1 SRPBCC domain-containing protein [Paracoccaceae bacterium]
MSELPTYIFEHKFSKPREQVWKAWTQPEMLSHWFGPNVETIIHKLDLKVSGLWHCEMKWGDNSMYQSGEYLEIVPPEKLVWLHSTTDANWNIMAMPNNWPRTMHSTMTLEESDGVTTQILTWVPHDANEAELTCFENVKEDMGKGWSAGMKLIEEMLA